MADENKICSLCRKEFPAEQLLKPSFKADEYGLLCPECRVIVWQQYLDENKDEEICGYECLGCGMSFDEEDIDGNFCPICGGSLDAMYF